MCSNVTHAEYRPSFAMSGRMLLLCVLLMRTRAHHILLALHRSPEYFDFLR